MKSLTRLPLNIWIRSLGGTAIVGFTVLAGVGTARAADLVCRGTMFGDTDFAAYSGENGFGRIELQYRRGGSVSVPLRYIRQNNQGESVFRGNNPDQSSDVVEVIAPARLQAGQSIQASYNGNVFPGRCSSTSGSRPPGDLTPTAGSFAGKGRATGAVFGSGRQADASLDFNRGNFSLGLFVPPGTGAQVRYQGTFNRLQRTSPDNPNSFVLAGQVRSFASSVNNLRVLDTVGSCRIEVFDARITSVSCSTQLPGSSTQFTGMAQF